VIAEPLLLLVPQMAKFVLIESDLLGLVQVVATCQLWYETISTTDIVFKQMAVCYTARVYWCSDVK